MKKTSKRLVTLLLCLLMLVSLLPAAAFADEPAANENTAEAADSVVRASVSWSNPLYGGKAAEAEFGEISVSDSVTVPVYLTGEEDLDPDDFLDSDEEATVQLREGFKKRSELIEIYCKTKENVDQKYVEDKIDAYVVGAVAHTGDPKEGDYLLYQLDSYECTAYAASDGEYTYLYYEFIITYYTSAAQESKMDTEVPAVLAGLGLDGKSDYEKVAAIYKYICDNVEYDYAGLADTSNLLKYSAYAALINKSAVCQGYAVLFYRMALTAGVDARIISGTLDGEPHAWNIVKLDGVYYALDCTLDAGKKVAMYTYFLCSEKHFALDHVRDEYYASAEFNSAYPMAKEDYSSEVKPLVATLSKDLSQMQITFTCEDEYEDIFFDAWSLNIGVDRSLAWAEGEKTEDGKWVATIPMCAFDLCTADVFQVEAYGTESDKDYFQCSILVEIPAAPTHVYTNEADDTCNSCGRVRKTDLSGVKTTPMYRLYNPFTGEHFYTGSTEERDTLSAIGWKYEGVAWNSPVSGGTPVHRVCNPNSGDHHYTTSMSEVLMLLNAGWQYENICWNSAFSNAVPQYRMWNRNADLGSHHYTSSTEERQILVDAGWIYEGIGWYGLSK